MRDRFYDNTRIKEFRGCPRKYYFRHVKDWTGTRFSAPLAFGSAWHAAMDVVWPACCSGAPQGDTQEIAQVAFEAFKNCWMDNNGADPNEMGPEQLDELGARNPFVGLEMLYNYIDERRDFMAKCELLSVEQPFSVPLDPQDDTLFYVGRLDKVVRHRKHVLVIEHKTTSLYASSGGFRSTFLDSFSPESQVDGYLHSIHMLYGDEAKAVWIDAALVHKKHHDIFKFIPIERQFDQLDAWLWETRTWIAQIEAHWAAMDQGNGSDPYLAAFPKNTNTCQDFARNCPYMDLCKAWSNPSKHTETPDGYISEPWSPFDRLELEKIGMEK